MAKYLEYYLAQARRISEHREAGSEESIRKEFKKLLKSLKTYISDVHEKYASGDGSLYFADLQKVGYEARFMEEIERRISVATPNVAKEMHKLVENTYELAYKSMIEGVAKVAAGADLDETFAEALAITPEQIRKTVDNPIMDVALEKNHRDIVYDIKQAVAVGLMNGDRYATIANKITVALDKENGPYKNAIRIARTESHRVREAGNLDAGIKLDEALQHGSSGLRMTKEWRTQQDERVRPQRRRKGKKGWKTTIGRGANHMKMQGQVVLANEPFDLLDGYETMAPGQSGVAGHDINCRCRASYKLMTDDEFFKKTGKHFPDWKAPETLENAGKSGIMNLQIFANRSIAKQTDNSLRKSIASWNNNIEEHKKKLLNPEMYDEDWHSKTYAQKAGLIRHWNKEIRNFLKDISDAEDELARRNAVK